MSTAALDSGLAEAQAALDAGQSGRVMRLLEAAPAADARVWRLRGLATLHAGQNLEAEMPLRRGAALGDPEARVEYGNWLRIIGQLAPAARELEELRATLPDGELAWRAQRWQGQALFQLGEVARGLELTEAAWQCYRQLGTAQQAAQLAQTLSQMHLHLGQLQQAQALAAEAVAALPGEHNPEARFLARFAQAQAQARLAQIGDARRSLEAARRELTGPDTRRARALHLSAEAEWRALGGEYAPARAALAELRGVAGEMHDYQLRLWTVRREAELKSLQGRYSQALSALYELGTPQGLPPALRTTRGLLLRRQRQYEQAAADLTSAPALEASDPLLYWRAQLHLADTWLQLHRPERVSGVLKRALDHLNAAEDVLSFAPDLGELGELVQWALLEPDLAPDTDHLLARVQAALLPVRPPRLRLDVRTLGRARLFIGDQPKRATRELSPGAILVLVYLFLKPQTSRNAMQAVLFPDFNRYETTMFFRTAVRELRAQLGHDVLLLDDTLRHPRYHVAEDVHLILDLAQLRACLAASDLTGAARLYKGAFFGGLEPESDWANQLRAEMQLALKLELRARLEAAQTPAALKRALRLAGRLLEADEDIAQTGEAEEGGEAESACDLTRALDDARRRWAEGGG